MGFFYIEHMLRFNGASIYEQQSTEPPTQRSAGDTKLKIERVKLKRRRPQYLRLVVDNSHSGDDGREQFTG